MALRDKLKFWLALNNYIERVVHNTSLLSLPNAMEDSLDYLKALGGTEITPKVYFDSVTADGGCEQRNLPSEYTQLEYIWMKENSYLLTDIIPTYDGRYELDMQTLSLRDNPQTYFGARDDSTSTSGLRFAHITNKTCRVYGLSDTYITSSDSMTNNTHYKFVYDNKSVTVSAGDTVLLTGTFESDQVITTPLVIGGWNTNGTIAVNAEGMYVYSFKAFNAQGELVADYVPAIQKGTSLVVGFYDTVSKTFKTATAGTFTAGPNAVPTPDKPMNIYCNNGALKTRHQSGLPLGYILLDYIESTGTQYIDTGYKSSNNTKVKAQISCPNFGTFVFGSRNDISGDTQKRFGLFFNTTWNPQYANQNGTGGLTTADTIYNIEMSQDGFYVNGGLETSFVSATFSGDYSMYLFANNTADTTIGYGFCRIYSFEIYTNNVLEHKYIPCKNSLNILGMYDTVSGQFLTNSGTGDFVAGNVVNDLELYVDNLVPTGKNLFDSSVFNTYVGDTISYTYHQIPNGTYTMSTNFPPQTGQVYTNVWIMAGIQTSGQSSEINGVSLGHPKTITVTDGWYTVAYRSAIPAIPQNPKDYNWQLEKGSTTTDYEPYLTKHKVETIQITGKNLFDAQWQTGIYSPTSGNYAMTANRICNVNMIQVKPSTAYTISCPDYALASGMRWLFYDANKNFISAITNGVTTITTPSNAKYINFYIANNLTVITAPDVQIEQGSTATTYEPYFDGGSATTEMLLSIGDYKDTQEVLSGNITRNIGIKVLDGTEEWNMGSALPTFALVIQESQGNLTAALCTNFKGYSGAWTNMPNNSVMLHGTRLGFRCDSITSLEAWKRWLATQYTNGTPVIIAYPLATPTAESVFPQSLTYIDNYVLTIEDASISNPMVNATNSTHTIPTPDKPLDITCNNGVLKLSPNLLNDTNVVNAYSATGNYIYKGFFVNNISLYSSNANYRVAHCVLPAGSYRFETDTTNAYILRYAIGSTVTELFSDNQKQYIDFTITTTTEFSICWRNSTTTEFIGEHSWISKGATTYHPYGTIYADGTVETIEDTIGNTATTEMLLKVGDYQDVQSIIDGVVTRNVGVKVLDGTENWSKSGSAALYYRFLIPNATSNWGVRQGKLCYCTHVQGIASTPSGYNQCGFSSDFVFHIGQGENKTVTQFKSWLASQYDAGTPVIVVYPLATPTTESVVEQSIQVAEGNNIAEITQASLDNLELEAKYNNVP